MAGLTISFRKLDGDRVGQQHLMLYNHKTVSRKGGRAIGYALPGTDDDGKPIVKCLLNPVEVSPGGPRGTRPANLSPEDVATVTKLCKEQYKNDKLGQEPGVEGVEVAKG